MFSRDPRSFCALEANKVYMVSWRKRSCRKSSKPTAGLPLVFYADAFWRGPLLSVCAAVTDGVMSSSYTQIWPFLTGAALSISSYNRKRYEQTHRSYVEQAGFAPLHFRFPARQATQE